MGYESILLLVLSGMGVFVTIHHTLVAARGQQRALHLWFAVLALLVTCHQFINYLEIRIRKDDLAMLLDWWNWLIEVGMFMSFTTFIANYTGRGKRWIVLPVAGLAMLLALLHIVLPHGFAVTAISVETLPSGRLQIEFVSGLWYYVFVLALVGSVAWGQTVAIQYAKKDNRSRGIALSVALGIVSTAILTSIGDDLGLWDTPELIDHSFVALILFMSLTLSDEVVGAATLKNSLERSERKIRTTLDSINDAVIVADENGTISSINPAACNLCGVAEDLALGSPFSEIFTVRAANEPSLLGSVPDLSIDSGQSGISILTANDGSEHRVAFSIAPLKEREGELTGAVLVFRDTTQEHLLEEQLRQTQKMEALGQLAGGVAHDFNNLLGAIIGYTELLLVEKEEEQPDLSAISDDLNAIMRAAERAAGLTRQLLAFSRKQEPNFQVVNLHKLIREILTVVENTVDRRVEFEIDLKAGRQTVFGDASQLHGVLLNVCINARDAMPEGGTVHIESGNRTIDRATASELMIGPGEYIEATFSDTGTGIPEELHQKIFEPFFTTKEVGKGTGLGLAVAFSVMQDHSGTITVESTQGSGSTFTILLPLHAHETPSTSERSDGGVTRPARILVVDDEKSNRELIGRYLAEQGHKILNAADGSEAIRLVDDQANALDLVLLDIVLPKVHGTDVYDKIRTVRPDLPVIIMTGSARSEKIDRILADAKTGLLIKPFRRAILLGEISKVQKL